MSRDRTGRNDPCPCGSGRKFKHCCLRARAEGSTSTPTVDVSEALHEAIGERTFDSLDDVRAFAQSFMRERNAAPVADFHGLSPEQMGRLLDAPFDSPTVVRFPRIIDIEPEAPVATLFSLLIEAIGERGLKPTKTGNLPRRFCREAALALWGQSIYEANTRFGDINSETDFLELHATRLIAEQAGLVRRYAGRVILSREARRLLRDGGLRHVYAKLLASGARTLNWAYWDRYPELRIVQRSFAFTCYLLHRYGDVERDQAFYEEAFVDAFPLTLDEVEPTPYSSVETTVRGCYALRMLERFGALFGLVNMRATREDIVNRAYQVSATPLLHAAVKFPILSGRP